MVVRHSGYHPTLPKFLGVSNNSPDLKYPVISRTDFPVGTSKNPDCIINPTYCSGATWQVLMARSNLETYAHACQQECNASSQVCCRIEFVLCLLSVLPGRERPVVLFVEIREFYECFFCCCFVVLRELPPLLSSVFVLSPLRDSHPKRQP